MNNYSEEITELFESLAAEIEACDYDAGDDVRPIGWAVYRLNQSGVTEQEIDAWMRQYYTRQDGGK